MDAFGAFGPAWERMRRLLFVRSSVGVWFSFGLAFFLQDCAEGGNGLGNVDGNQAEALFRDGGPLARLGGHELALFGAIGFAVGIPLLLLALWLGARGQALALRSVMAGHMNLGAQWSETRAAGSRIFRFHLVFTAVLMVVVIAAFVCIWAMLSTNRDAPDAQAAVVLVGALAVCALFVLPLLVARSLVRNFVFPLMVAKDLTLGEGWRMFWGAARGRLGGLFLFFVARLIIGIGGAIMAVVTTLLTCCIGALPILHQTVMAPFYVFERSHALYTLASLGPDFALLETPPDDFGGSGYGVPPGGAGVPFQGGTGAAPPAGGFGARPEGEG